MATTTTHKANKTAIAAARLSLGSITLDRATALGVMARTKPKTSVPVGRTSGRPKYSTDTDRALTLIARSSSVAVDLETKGLHPHASSEAQIGAVILKTGGERFIFRELPEWWDEVLEDKDTRKIGANLKFDFMWMIDATGVTKARNVQDVMIKSQIKHRYRTFDGLRKAFPAMSMPEIRERWEPNDLAHIIEENLDIKIQKGDADNPFKIYHEDVWRYKGTGKNKKPVELLHKGVDWTGPWSEDMEWYMLEDIDYLEPANEALDKHIQDQGQERVSWIENNSVFGTAWMSYNGILPDVAAWMYFIGAWDETEKRFTGQRGDHEHLKWHLKKFFPEVSNFNSGPQMKPAVSRYVGSSIPNLRKPTLKLLAPHYRGIAILQDYNKLKTRLQNWGPSFLLAHVCKICGRFHPDWRQIGAETMRFSCSKPNVQQIPREVDYRKLFIAMAGYLLASLDYSAIEVVSAAVFAHCRNLLEACATGNPHGATAAMAMGIAYEAWLVLDEVTKTDTRQHAKIVNFGLLFGGGVQGLVTQARDLFDVVLSEDQAGAMIRSFYNIYPELRYSKNWAYRALEEFGPVEVRNLVGMRRWLEGWNRKPTSWLNTIIQSSAGHGIKSGFRYLMEEGLLPYLCMQVHDEFVFEFPEVNPYSGETCEDLVAIAQTCMMKGMKEVLGQDAPVRVDPKVGRFWM